MGTERRKIVSLHNAGVAYDGCVALEGVDLDIYSDDFIGIIGPNGGGKSSLVKAILGAVPHSGRVEIADELRKGSHYKIGYMPQVSQFDRHFPISIGELVLSGLQSEKGFFGFYTSRDKSRVRDLLAEAGIDGIASRPIGEVSGGQLQRALLCRAVIAEPKLLILDEPTNFVDNRFERELYAMLQRLNERMAVVMISHDLGTITSVVREHRMRQPPCPPPRLEHTNRGAVTQLRLSDTDSIARTYPPHRSGTPLGRLLPRPRIKRTALCGTVLVVSVDSALPYFSSFKALRSANMLSKDDTISLRNAA